MLNFNRFLLSVGVAVLLQACSTPPTTSPDIHTPPSAQKAAPLKNRANLTPSSYSRLNGWQSDDFHGVKAAFQSSCSYFRAQQQSVPSNWLSLCNQAQNLSDAEMRHFFESNFTPYQVGKGSAVQGKLTSYATPIVKGNRPPCRHDQTAFYSRPAPHLKKLPRAKLINGALKGHEIACIDNVADAYESMIQGTTFIKNDTELFSVRPADHNGHSYKSIYPQIGLDMKDLKRIAAKLPNAAKEITTLNPRYIYYMPSSDQVLGTLNTPLIAERSLAVDPAYINYGFPIWLSGTKNRLVMAHDTGDAIRGAVRGDYFHGLGDTAMSSARMINGTVTFHILLPNNTYDLKQAPTASAQPYQPIRASAVAPSPRTATKTGHVVQLGVFSNQNSAQQQLSRLQSLGHSSPAFKTTIYPLSNGSFRVLTEGFPNAQQAREYCSQLQQSAFDCFYKKL